MPESGVQINPKIKPTTKALLQAFCTERKCSQGEAVEEALEAFLAPGAEDHHVLMFQKLNGLEQGMTAVVGLLTQVVAQLEAQAKPAEVPRATYAQMYAILTPPEPVTVVEEEPLPQPSGPSWWRAFFGRYGGERFLG